MTHDPAKIARRIALTAVELLAAIPVDLNRIETHMRIDEIERLLEQLRKSLGYVSTRRTAP